MSKRKRHAGAGNGSAPSGSPFAALAGMRAELPKQRAVPPRKKPEVSTSAAHPSAARSASVRSSSSVASTGGYSRDDRLAFKQAFAGVRPLAKKALHRPVASAPMAHEAQEAAARARLDALVGGSVRFDVQRHEGELRALRQGMHADHLKALLEPGVQPDLEFDLHGLTSDGAQQRLSRFVRQALARGARTLLIIHGRGHGSAGEPVLGDAAFEALTKGGAAPLVSALATAPRALGGAGALLVRLGER